MTLWLEAFGALLVVSFLLRLALRRNRGDGLGTAITASLFALLICALAMIVGSLVLGFPYGFMMVAVLSPVIIPVLVVQIAFSYLMNRRISDG